MAQRGRDERAACDAMDVDNAGGASDRRGGPRANRDGRARRDNPPTTGGGASNEQSASEEDAETKKLLEEFRALVPPRLWERVQTTARAYYSRVFRVKSATRASDAQELRESLERLEKKVDKIAGASAAPTNKTWAQVAGTGAGGAAPAPEQRVQRVPKKLFRELIVDTGDAGPDITNRSPRDTVTAVNTAAGPTGPKGAIAAKRLPKSGNIAITFEEEYWSWFADEANQAWVTKAFG
ncbi:hypothetical protein C8A03DRAFT_32417, partial [Achaetomium macrosporum]